MMTSVYSPFLVDIKITENAADQYLRSDYDTTFRILSQRSTLNNFQVSQLVHLSLELKTEIVLSNTGVSIRAFNI